MYLKRDVTTLQKRKTMKHIILFFALFFISLISFGQGGYPPKGANVVLVKNNLNSTENYKYAMNRLLDAGFSILRTDSNFKTITTDFKTVKDCKGMTNALFTFNVRCKDGEIITQGGYKLDAKVTVWGVTVGENPTPLEFKGLYKKRDFGILMDFCDLFNGVQTYLVN